MKNFKDPMAFCYTQLRRKYNDNGKKKLAPAAVNAQTVTTPATALRRWYTAIVNGQNDPVGKMSPVNQGK